MSINSCARERLRAGGVLPCENKTRGLRPTRGSVTGLRIILVLMRPKNVPVPIFINLKGDVYGSWMSNPTITAEQNELLWSDHSAFGNDGRTFGDNYNYFGDPDDETICPPGCPPVCPPECPKNDLEFSPILSHSPRAIPCFLYPPCNPQIEDPENPEYCVDIFCGGQDFGYFEFPTNINGKYGVLFNTQGWGGDNFQFAASIDNYQQ